MERAEYAWGCTAAHWPAFLWSVARRGVAWHGMAWHMQHVMQVCFGNQGLEPRPPANELQAEYDCPICLSLLHNPVVLTCAHRFCWGCLLSHCATTLRSRGALFPASWASL